MDRFKRSALDYFRRTDKLLWLVMLAISVYSLILLAPVPNPDAGARSFFSIHLLAICLGYAAAFVLTLMDYREISRYWYLLAAFAIFLVVYTKVAGRGVVGSGGLDTKAWIVLPGINLTFQPSELIKIIFIVTFAKHIFALRERGLLYNPVHVVLLSLHALIPVATMYLLQGDTGSAVVFFAMFLVMAMAGGIQKRYFLLLFGFLGVALPLAWNLGVIPEYQKIRLMIFRNPESDPLDKGLQILQGKYSIGSGGLSGRGLFTAPRVQQGRVPIQQSDYIFSVAGESLGFIGCVAIIVLLLALLLLTLRVARRATEPLGELIGFGFFAMIAVQTLANLGMCLNLLPVMGITLPFFSAGGSSAACLYLGFGLLQSVAMHKTSPDYVVLRHK